MTLKNGIELILDEKIAEKQAKEKTRIIWTRIVENYSKDKPSD